MVELDISLGKHRADTAWKTEYWTWEEFVERVRQVRRTSETMAQYDKMSSPAKGKVKDGPAFVGGAIRGGRRKKENLDSRSLITLDADFADADFFATVDLMIGSTAYLIYSTHSHRGAKPKYRLIVPLDRSAGPDEYAAVSRKLAADIGIHYFDKTTFDVHRLMYWPSCSKDAEPVLEVAEGDPLCVDDVLAQYDNWSDVMSWPRHPDEARTLVAAASKAQDPREKHGTIGLLCRAYTIEEGIAEFLSEVYTPGTMPNRYTYVGGSSGNGLEVYPDQELAYSHQDSDPVSDGRTYNLFDLVRVHKFGHLDDRVDGKTAPDAMPSYLAMKTWAASNTGVKARMQAEATSELIAEFADLDFEDDSVGSTLIEVSGFDFSKAKIPIGFKVIEGKLFEVKETKTEIKHVPVCDSLVAVTGRHINLTDNTYGLDVVWKTAGVVKTLSHSRSTFMDSKKIINLADYGFPVHSGNARALSSFLSRFESANQELIPSEQVSNQMGWVKKGFLLGDRFIGEEAIQFLPNDAGDNQTAGGFHPKGSKEESFRILQQVKQFPSVVLAVYAALAAPLLHLVDESPFIFELAGGTSKGKTTALRIAASLYGCPDEQKPGFFKQWNMTKVYVERYASSMNHLPLIIDDTKKADPRIIPPTIYQFCSGQGRGRGSLKGSQIGATWCTTMLTTGEQKLTSFSRDGGAVGRVLSLHGAPFESTDEQTGVLVEKLNIAVSENYGHLAEPWIRFLQGADIKSIKTRIHSAGERYRGAAAAHGEVAMRLSRVMAILDTVGQMADECFSMSLYCADQLSQVWLKMLTGATEIDRPLEAMEAVIGWVNSRQKQFLKENDKSHYGPVLSGRIQTDTIIVIGEQLDTYLESKGYEPNAMARAWREKNWIKCDEGRLKKTTRLAGGLVKAYHFDLEAIGVDFVFEKDYSEFGED